jgi:hypothetical protein
MGTAQSAVGHCLFDGQSKAKIGKAIESGYRRLGAVAHQEG